MSPFRVVLFLLSFAFSSNSFTQEKNVNKPNFSFQITDVWQKMDQYYLDLIDNAFSEKFDSYEVYGYCSSTNQDSLTFPYFYISFFDVPNQDEKLFADILEVEIETLDEQGINYEKVVDSKENRYYITTQDSLFTLRTASILGGEGSVMIHYFSEKSASEDSFLKLYNSVALDIPLTTNNYVDNLKQELNLSKKSQQKTPEFLTILIGTGTFVLILILLAKAFGSSKKKKL